MDEKRQRPDIEQRIGEVREGVAGADATGMIADEEFITQAEMLSSLQTSALPQEEMHAALPKEHAAHATIDDLHAEIEGSAPDRSSIETHVRTLRSLPELEAIVANWWDSPATQRFIWNLTQTGL